MKYTKKERKAIEKCIKQWEAMSEVDYRASEYIENIKVMADPDSNVVDNKCYLCELWFMKGEPREKWTDCDPKCPLNATGKECGCEDPDEPYGKIADRHGNTLRVNDYKRWCQQIVDICKVALNSQTG